MSVQIIVPRFGGMTGTAQRTIENELRFGTWLNKRLEREKADTKRRMVAAALPYKNARRQMGEFNLTGIVDARTYFRWIQNDPDFFRDKGNWKRFIRDNPEVQPWRT